LSVNVIVPPTASLALTWALHLVMDCHRRVLRRGRERGGGDDCAEGDGRDDCSKPLHESSVSSKMNVAFDRATERGSWNGRIR
jgi:hypothetical protein